MTEQNPFERYHNERNRENAFYSTDYPVEEGYPYQDDGYYPSNYSNQEYSEEMFEEEKEQKKRRIVKRVLVVLIFLLIITLVYTGFVLVDYIG